MEEYYEPASDRRLGHKDDELMEGNEYDINTDNEMNVACCSRQLYVKVYMEGHPIGRKLNVMAHDGYQHLIATLDQMFNTNILCTYKLFNCLYIFKLISCMLLTISYTPMMRLIFLNGD